MDDYGNSLCFYWVDLRMLLLGDQAMGTYGHSVNIGRQCFKDSQVDC